MSTITFSIEFFMMPASTTLAPPLLMPVLFLFLYRCDNHHFSLEAHDLFLLSLMRFFEMIYP